MNSVSYGRRCKNCTKTKIDSKNLFKTILYFKEICFNNVLNLVIIGSVVNDIKSCDDLDCIIIYDDISKLRDFDILNNDLYSIKN
jgi:hypothetical protein